MNAQTAFTMRQAFAILWNRAETEGFYRKEVRLWLRSEGWEALFPGHCFRCHGFEDGPCHTDDGGMHECPGCMKEEQEHQLAVLQAKMGRNEPLTKKQAEDILNGKPIEEMKRLKDSE